MILKTLATTFMDIVLPYRKVSTCTRMSSTIANAKENIMKNSSLFNDTYLSSSFKDYYSKPSAVSTFDLELAISGMPKNSKLPVPYRNYSLMDGRFGDDAGFTMQGMENNFLGNSFRLLREACSSTNLS